MSVEAVSWALGVPIGGNGKVVLLGLANHAHPDGSEAYPSLETLATYAACDRSTAKRNVHKLVDAGWICPDGYGPRGQIKYRLAMGDPFSPVGGQDAPGAAAPARGGNGACEGGAPVPPEPSLGTVQNQPKKETGAREPRDRLPDDFPEELRPHAVQVYRILRAVANDHGARKVWPRALGLAIMAYPRRPLVETAHALAGWAVDPGRPIKDVVATYRTFLKRERDLQATERLSADGLPATGSSPAPGGNVHPIHGRGSGVANVDRVEAQIQRLDAAAAAVDRRG